MRSACLMNCISSSVDLNDCSIMMGCNMNNCVRVQTHDKIMYSQFLKQMLFLSLGQDDTMTMSFYFPCTLCPIDELLMLTGNDFIWHLNVSLISHKQVGVIVTDTLCCSGEIVKS